MTGHDRFVATFRGAIPDRVPFLPTISTDHACHACGRDFAEALMNPQLAFRCRLEAALLYQADAVRFHLGPSAIWEEEKDVRWHDGRLLQFDRRSGKAEGHFDVDGGGTFIPDARATPASTAADVRALPVLSAEDILAAGCLRHASAQLPRARAAGLFVIGMCPGQTINYMVRHTNDPAAALMMFYDDPDLARALIDKAVSTTIEQARAFIRIGVDCIYIGDSYASGSVISPEIYRSFCAPAYREICQEVKAQGAFCYKHCCGNYDPLLADLPDLGLDAMDGIDPTCGMSVARTKQTLGDQLTLMGGISCLALLQGTADEVYAEARSCLEQGMPDGRYVLGSACAVPRFAPSENLHAARRAVEDVGTYPPSS